MAILEINPHAPKIIAYEFADLDWDGWTGAEAPYSQTITLQGVESYYVLPTDIVFVAPAPAFIAQYAACGIRCTKQGTNTLTFKCDTIPVKPEGSSDSSLRTHVVVIRGYKVAEHDTFA